MKALIQRVKKASVTVDGKLCSQIGHGLLVLLGVVKGDEKLNADKLAEKLVHLRIFDDENGVMNQSLLDVSGSILSISQFTLYADCYNGNRPSFTDAAKPDFANELYEYIVEECKKQVEIVETGVFGADMKVGLVNDGPVTIILEKNVK